MSNKLRFVIFLLAFFVSKVNSQAQIWLTTGDAGQKLNQQPDILGNANPTDGIYTIGIDRTWQAQYIKGFGAALSNSASYLLWNSFERDTVLNDLFNVNTGIGISYIRLVMGGSDFNAVAPYTYNDAGYQDLDLNEFSIDKDRDFVLPLLKLILQINPAVRILASPWSAPAFFKDSGSLYGGSFMGDNYYQAAYSDFFVKFVRAYEAEGIHIDAITLQNEPAYDTPGYPTMTMDWTIQQSLIRDYLGPAFQQQGITTEILIWDHNWDGTWYPMNILADPNAAQYITGTAWHCYNGNRFDPTQVNIAFPNIGMYFTECSGGEWDPDFGSSLSWNTQNLFIGQTRIGSRTVLLWNLALDQNHGPLVGANGCQDCRGVVTVNPGNQPHDKNVEYYTIGHFSKFVRPNARNIWSDTFENDGLESSAFQNPDGSVAVVVVNLDTANPKSFQIYHDGVYYVYNNLPARSVITFFKD